MSARHGILVALLASAIAVTACGSNSATSPTTTTTSTRSSPATDTWSSLLTPGGAQSRAVTTIKSGTITLTLIGADVPLSIGIGVPRTSSAASGCRLTLSQYVDSPSTSIAADVETGNYCVEIFDQAGLIVKQANFTAQVVYP